MSTPVLRQLPNESWNYMLPGPPSRNNFGSADFSPSGSSVSVVDSRSLSLLLPPLHSPTSSLPFGGPHSLLSTEPSSSHLILAAADRHGHISLLDFRLRSIDPPDPSSKSGVQDRPDSFLLAAD